MVLDLKSTIIVHFENLFGDNFAPGIAALVVSIVAGLMFFPILMLRTLVGIVLAAGIGTWLYSVHQRAHRVGESFLEALSAPIRGLSGDVAPPKKIRFSGRGLEPGTYWLKTDKWAYWYMYMQNNNSGNVRAYEGDPGPQGHMKLTKIQNGFWLMSPVQWPRDYVYMQEDKNGNVRGCNQEPGPKGHWRIEPMGENMYRFSTEEWPDCYMYMQDTNDGNVRGWNKEDPGQQGWWKLIPVPSTVHTPLPVLFDPTKFYSFTTEKWPEWYEYMQDNRDGNVRGWKQDPESQGHWKIEENPEKRGTFLLSSKKWPNCYMYMQNNGNVRGWNNENPGPQGWWIIKKNPLNENTYLFSTEEWPNRYKYMQDNDSGNVRGHDHDAGPQGYYSIRMV